MRKLACKTVSREIDELEFGHDTFDGHALGVVVDGGDRMMGLGRDAEQRAGGHDREDPALHRLKSTARGSSPVTH